MESILLQMLSAFVGAAVVYVFGIRHLSIQLRNSFIEKQLAELYSPLAGYRKRIRSKGEIRGKISGLASEAWVEICGRYSQAGQVMHDHDQQFAPFKKIIEYDNKQLREELLPLYRKMLDVFTDKYWLADEDTRQYYGELVEFIEIWERYLVESMPREVLVKLNHSEDKLQDFYSHLELKLTGLQSEVKDSRFWPRV